MQKSLILISFEAVLSPRLFKYLVVLGSTSFGQGPDMAETEEKQRCAYYTYYHQARLVEGSLGLAAKLPLSLHNGGGVEHYPSLLQNQLRGAPEETIPKVNSLRTAG